MVQSLDLQVNLAQTSEVGRLQQASIHQTIALHEHLGSKLELEAENAQTSVEITQNTAEEQRTDDRKGSCARNPFWGKRQRNKMGVYAEEIEGIPHPTKGKFIDVWR